MRREGDISESCCAPTLFKQDTRGVTRTTNGNAGGGAPAPAPAPASGGAGDIFDDLFGGGAPAPAAPAPKKLSFSKTPVNKAKFQGHWKQTPSRYSA